MGKKVAPMWQVNEMGEVVLYHYSDKVRAESQGEAKLVWVAMDSDYFIGTWQFAEDFAHGTFDSEEEAYQSIK